MKDIGYRHLPAACIKDILPEAEIAGVLNVFTGLSLVLEKLSRGNDSACICFVEQERFIGNALSNPLIKGVLLRRELFRRLPHTGHHSTFIVTDRPADDFYRLHNYLYHHTDFYSNPEAPRGRKIGDSTISPTAVIEDGAVIGDGCHIMDHCVVRKGVVIGNRVLIQQGTVIGSIGFEPKQIDGKLTIVPHDGAVCVGDDVEIGANTVIDRGIYGIDTRIGNSTKIDNLVHVGHNCQIGNNCMIVAGAVIGGSTVVGEGVWIGPGAVVSDSLRIGDKARISLGAVVIDDVKDAETVSGNFAVNHKIFMAKWFPLFRLKNKTGTK